MSPTLPEKGQWHVSDRHRPDAAPFDLIKLDLRKEGSGIVRARNLETRLQRIRLTGPDRFAAVYDIRGHRGAVEGMYRPDGSLRLALSGTVTGTFIARAADAVGAEGPAQALAGAFDALCRSACMARTVPA